MIDTLQIATMGLAPGFTPYQCATLGFGLFEIVITIPTGASNINVTDVIDSRREVIVTIRYKQNIWKKILHIDSIILDNVIKISAAINSIKQTIISIFVNKKSIINKYKNIIISIKK